MKFPFGLPGRYDSEARRLDGGQGYVYVLHDQFLDRDVAIKVYQHDPDASLIRNELRTLSEIRSPHTAEIYDLVTARKSGMIGLVQEYVPGPDLAQWIAQPRDLREILLLLYQVCRGLQAIHAANVIHRDIKPENILIDTEGVAKILDFGLSCLAEGAETMYGRGTTCYIAPELYRTGPVKFTPAVDVYACGVLAWYLLSGGKLSKPLREHPPGSGTPIQSFATIRSDLPASVITYFDRSLSIDPCGRPMVSDLAAILEAELLRGKHIAFLSSSTGNQRLDATVTTASLQSPPDSITIRYTGVGFVVAAVAGAVYINNAPASVNYRLPGSCVITLGAPSQGPNRVFVTVDMSHPGLVI